MEGALGGSGRALGALRRVRYAGFALSRVLASRAAIAAALSIAASILGGATPVAAQDSSRAILGIGNAVVTGFSGVRPPPAPLPTGVNPVEGTFIDLDRPSARIINLDALTGAPAAQLVPAPKPFSVAAGQIGQVFAVALDDATPPNIYLAATSAYGLPIVVPDRDGDGRPDRSRRGGPNANFMPGLFGPVTVNGGPGSIWKIDGRTGAVALFANVTLDGVANSGAALGGLAFDSASRQLFVADRNTGMIHRFTLDGIDRGRFDHGVDALRTAGIAQVQFDPRIRLDLTNVAFDSGNPATWAYAPPARRIFALAYRSGRIYYAVAAGLQIWSVSIAPNGAFGSDPRLELNVPPGQSTEISNIVFDDAGRMIIAERGAPTGAHDYVALAAAGENRVLRFRLKRPEDPPNPGLWVPVPEEYAIGFPPNFRNDNGGLALGYGYGANGAINRAVCGGTLWSTGEQLRNARDPSLIQRLQPGGPLVVNGLQGNGIDLVRPQNEPPFQTYFVDYDDRFEDPAARGHLGDVEIWRVCAQTAVPPPLLPLLLPPLVCPPGWLDVGGVCVTGQACPQGTEFANGCCVYRDCPASYVRINGRCVPPPVLCRVGETYADGRCIAAMCPPGLVVQPPKNGNGRTGNEPAVPKILKGVTDGTSNTIILPTDPLCPGGGTPSNGCANGTPVSDGGKKMCAGYCGCPEGTKPDANGKCVPTPPPGLCPIPPLTMVNGKCCAVSRDLSVEVICRPKGRGESCDTSEIPYQDTMCCSRGGSCTPSSDDSCSEGLHRVCGGDGPLKACSCERCPQGELLICDDRDKCRCLPTPELTDTCPAGTNIKCSDLESKSTCECVPSQTDVCPIGRTQVCTGRGQDRKCTCEPPTTGECQFPNVQQADGTCCKFGEFQAGKCGSAPECLSCKEGEKYCKPGTLNSIDCVSTPPTNECRPSGVWSCCTQDSINAGTCTKSPPPPVRGDCSALEQLRGDCVPPPVRADCTGLQQRRGECVPPPVRADCTGLQQRRGECVPPPQTSQPPSDSPGAQLGFCPSTFTMVGASCCNPLALTGGFCMPRVSGSACPSHYVPVGDGVTGQCCRQAAIKCTRTAENASCPSGEVPIREGAVFACCREDPAGNCTPPSTPTPNPPSVEGGGFPNLCDIPLLGLLCVPPPALSCASNADCPSDQSCRDGVCAKAPTANSACSPPSLVVNGVCCTAEAVAAGTCGQQAAPPAAGACKAGLFPSNDGKTCCTKEEITRETCGIPPAPQKVQKIKTTTKPAPKKQEIVCQKGFHLEGNRCVADSKPQAIPGLNIQFGIGIGGGGRPGGGKPGGGSPPSRPPSTPN